MKYIRSFSNYTIYTLIGCFIVTRIASYHDPVVADIHQALPKNDDVKISDSIPVSFEILQSLNSDYVSSKQLDDIFIKDEASEKKLEITAGMINDMLKKLRILLKQTDVNNNKKKAKIVRILQNIQPSQVSKMIAALSQDQRTEILSMLPQQKAAEILSNMQIEHAQNTLSDMMVK